MEENFVGQTSEKQNLFTYLPQVERKRIIIMHETEYPISGQKSILILYPAVLNGRVPSGKFIITSKVASSISCGFSVLVLFFDVCIDDIRCFLLDDTDM